MKAINIRPAVRHANMPPCQQTVYAASYLQDGNTSISGAYELLYTQGDPTDTTSFPRWDPNYPQTDPNRGADRIRLWTRKPAQGWKPHQLENFPHQNTNVVISNHLSFKWMQSNQEEYLAKHPESYIGATASPSVFKLGDKYVAYFTATAGDPFVTTARQFTLYKLVSDTPDFEGVVASGSLDHPNIAVQNAELWFGDFTPAQKYPTERGITTVSTLVDDYLYLMLQVWTDVNGLTIKNGLVRFGENGYEIWKAGDEWEAVVNGQLPDWYVKSDWATGNPFMWIIEQILLTPEPLKARGRYMAVASPDSALWVSYSNNLSSWGPPERVELEVPVSGIRSPRLVKNGDLWVFNTNDASMLSPGGKVGIPGCNDAFHGQVVCEADNVL